MVVNTAPRPEIKPIYRTNSAPELVGWTPPHHLQQGPQFVIVNLYLQHRKHEIQAIFELMYHGV